MDKKPIFRKVIDLETAKQLLEQMHWDRGYPSGYKALDALCGGLVKDGVTLIAGRPAMGKTSLVLNIVSRLAQQQDGTILIFSPKMWADEATIRLLSIGMDLAPENFLNNKLPPAVITTKFLDYYAAKESSIKIDSDSFLSLDDIWDRCFSIPDLRLVVIDPVGDVCTPIEDSANWGERELPDVVFRSLQELARRLNVPVLCTTHLHRSLERRKNKRPHLGDLKKMGIPTELVDQVIFLYRDRYYDPAGEEGAEWIVAKAAQGSIGTVRLDWDHTTRRFTERDK